MSDSEPASQPRRSQRDKRQSQPFLSSSQLKRKRSDDTDDEAASDINTEHNDEPSDEEGEQEEEEEEAYVAPKKTAAAGGAKRGRPKGTTTTRTRAPKAATAKPATTTRARRKPRAGAEAFDADAVAKETRLNSDNALFNAIMNPSTALKLTAEEFMDSLSNDENTALADLVNCMFRACGCNESVSPDVAVDEDGVVDRLDEITEVLKQDDSPIYPLTSKLPMFKKFRKSLAEFLHRLVAASAETGLMYSTVFIDVFKHWVAAMSSSQLRSFRHTATVLALEVETALCDVAAAVDKEASTTERQLEAEKKRKGPAGAKGKAASRVKELEQKADEIRERRDNLTETLKALTDGVFVNRYRDLDPAIRAECIHALGQWFKKYPSYFVLEGAYLRYVGWTLSDQNNPVRLESVRALSNIYDNPDHIASLQAFTERFKTRFIEMAKCDTDLAVRVSMIQVLSAIDGHELLDDEEREELCLLAYDPEVRVRKAVSVFVQGVWDDIVKERLAGRKANEQEKSRAGVKALGSLLVKLSKALEKKAEEEEEDTADEMRQDGSGGLLRVGHLMAIANGESKSRIAFAVEALWDDVEPVRDWEALLDVLLLDHSAEDASQGRKRKGKAKPVPSDSAVDEAWRLEEVEEATLLEVLVTSLSKAKADAAASTKKSEGENVASDITRALIKGLPALFAKHQADEKRIAQVLLIPPLMNFDLYLEMRMMTAYEALWDDIIKQFTSHSSPTIISHAMSAILTLLESTSLSNVNTVKTTELADVLANSLRELVAGREELAITTLSEDDTGHLGAVCTRIAAVVQRRDMKDWMEEDEDGNQSSVCDIVNALADRGKLGYREEETMVQQCLVILSVHAMWKSIGIPEEPEEETPLHDAYIEHRETLIKKLVEFAIGNQSNTSEEVQRVAFKQLMNIHLLFSKDASPDPLLALELADEVQDRCAGYIEAEIERFAEEIEELTDEEESQHSGSDGSDAEDTQTIKKRKRVTNGNAKPKQRANGTHVQRSQLERQLLFNDLVNSFTRAIVTGAVNARHGKVIFVHYGRLGKMCDLVSAKALMEHIRDLGLYEQQGELVTSIVIESLRDAFTSHLEGVVGDESQAVALAKLLVGTLMKRGAHLSIERKLASEHIVAIHTNLLSWAIKQIGGHEANKNKKSRNSAILFFRVLQPLLGPVDERDALRIKAHMDQAIAQAKLQVSATSPVWEPQRAFERRLNNIMTKGKGGAGRGKKAKATANPTTTDEEQSGQSEAEIEQDIAPAPKPRPRARPVRATRARQPSAPLSEAEDEPEPQRTPARPTRKNPSPRKAGTESPNKTPKKRQPDARDEDREATPKASTSTSRKRAREDEDEDEEMTTDEVVPPSPVSNGVRESPVAPPSPASSQASLRITRKRVRR